MAENAHTEDYITKLEILLEKHGNQPVTKALGVSLRSIQNYTSETSPTKPSNTVIRKIHESFAKHIQGLPIVELKKPSPVEDEGFKDKYIAALEKLVKEQESLLTTVQSRLTEVERMLSETMQNQRIAYSFQLAFQEYWVEYFGCENGSLAAAESKIGQKALSHLERLPKEGTLL